MQNSHMSEPHGPGCISAPEAPGEARGHGRAQVEAGAGSRWGLQPPCWPFPGCGWDKLPLTLRLFFLFPRNQTKLLVGDEKGRIFCWSAEG